MMSGEEAGAVLLDWRMPGLDGLAVLRRMRECRIQTPVIFLTVLSDEIYEEAALKWGAVDFIDKSRRLPIILRSEEHTSELQSLMRITYAVFCLKKKNKTK